jgi:hypothetical protein
MLDWMRHLIENYGDAIVVVVAAEGVGLPLPGETALITAAAFSAQGTGARSSSLSSPRSWAPPPAAWEATESASREGFSF